MKGLNKMHNDQTAPEWERIKKWLGASDTVDKHPVQEHFERQAQKMSEGGMAGMDDDPNRLLQEIAPPSAGTLTTSPSRTPLPTPQPLQPVAPPHPVPQPVVQPPQPQIPQQPMVPATPPSGPTSGQQADSVLGTNQQELRDYLTKLNTPSWGERAGNAVTGLGDAIIQGVGRAGPGHFQENFQKANQNTRQALSAIPGQVAGLGKEKFELTQKMDAENPESPFSKISQQTYGPDLVKMGLKPEEVQRMPASLIGDLMAKKVSLQEAKARLSETSEMHRQTVAFQNASLANTAQHQRAEEANATDEENFKRDTEASKHWITHPLNAIAASGRLSKGSSNESAPVPQGRVTVLAPDGTVGHIPANQLKAAIKKGYKQQ